MIPMGGLCRLDPQEAQELVEPGRMKVESPNALAWVIVTVIVALEFAGPRVKPRNRWAIGNCRAGGRRILR